MKIMILLLPLLLAVVSTADAQTTAPEESLNHYIEFLTRSVDIIMTRFEMLQHYQEEITQYRKRPDMVLRLPSSGPPQDFYYQKACNTTGLKPSEKKQLNTHAQSIWRIVGQLDEKAKALETYVKLRAYETDSLRQSDVYVSEMMLNMSQFHHEKDVFYQEIRKIYLTYSKSELQVTHPLLKAEKLMEEVLASQQQVIDSLPFYLDETTRASFPLNMLSQSMLNDESYIDLLNEKQPALTYPASSSMSDFIEAVEAIQLLKKRAIDAHNYVASLNARNANETYLSALKHFNQYLLPVYQSFVSYAAPTRLLLSYPACSPVIRNSPLPSPVILPHHTPPFKDVTYENFQITSAAIPASPTTFAVLNQYVDFINESLRQMHQMQLMMRNYQHSAEPYRDPAYAMHRLTLSFLPGDFNIPSATYTLLANASTSLPHPYRVALVTQAQVLINVLKEMEGLSAELMTYTSEKSYIKDQLKRSDAILDRYAVLFDIFDQKKEKLYLDLRRIHASYPEPAPKSAWITSGAALQDMLDEDKRALFGVRDFISGETDELPPASRMHESGRKLLANEYTYMHGLQHFGRSNGLCPYSPYEDLAENSVSFAEKIKKIQRPGDRQYGPHPYESFYYFYNNELVYQYNKFVELAKSGLLRAVNQPDVYAFIREKPVIITKATPETPSIVPRKSEPKNPAPDSLPRYVDTMYIGRPAVREVVRSLEGYAPNNMVLLLDISASMNAPNKLPLLKQTIKSLLTLVRNEDYISIVLYSGKARVALSPTPGSRSAAIGQVIDHLRTGGTTDADGGLTLAYEVAAKQYIHGGNNRIVLATDGEFPLSNAVQDLVVKKAREDISLTIFAFGKSQRFALKLRKVARLGHGNYVRVTTANAELRLIEEAQGASARYP